MAWRGIHLSRPAYLSADRQSMRMEFRDDQGGEFRISLEDLAYLIIDTPEVALSSTILSQLSENSVLVVGVNARHLPVWSALPWTSFHKHGEVLPLQIQASLPLKKQLWTAIIFQKLRIQAECLDLCGRDGGDQIRAMGQHLRSGDPDNTEARAARAYWSYLFNDRSFRRHDEDLPNAMLNYGYAILRAALARLLCGVGFIPQLGLHHDSQTNAFNLADDLLEPYRPWVDRRVVRELGNTSSEIDFGTQHRRSIAPILETTVEFNGEEYGMLAALEVTVASLKSALQEKEPTRLRYPDRLLA